MLKFAFALFLSLMLSVPSFAQTRPSDAVSTATDKNDFAQSLLVTAGIVGGLIVVDIVTRGPLTTPLLRMIGLRSGASAVAMRAPISPAVAEARAAGAVLGEQITAATAARDAAARQDLVYVGILGVGAFIGGWLFSHILDR